MESPDKRRQGTFGSAGSIYPDRKAYPEGHPLRPVAGATRHSSLGDHKSLEAEALAEVYMRIMPLFGGLLTSAPCSLLHLIFLFLSGHREDDVHGSARAT